MEQRLYPEYALAALSAPHASSTARALGVTIAKEINEQWPVAKPSLAGFAKVPSEATVSTTHFTVKVSSITGGIRSLVPTSIEAQVSELHDPASNIRMS